MATEGTKKLIEDAARLERKTGSSGAIPRTPKQNIINDPIDAYDAKNPERVSRLVNIKDPQKVASRKADGYVRVPESEGGVQLGDELALFSAPKRVREERVARQQEVNEARLGQHKTEMYHAVEAVAKEMRDKHGIPVNTDRLFVNE